MTNINLDSLLDACAQLQRKTIWHDGCMHSSAKCFDACMRAFDRKVLPAQAITFAVYFNTPILAPGFARITRDGNIQFSLHEFED